MKTSELTGAALDWAVAKCEGFSATGYEARRLKMRGASFEIPKHWKPTEDWAQGGPIIEREGMALNMEDTHAWQAAMWWDDEDSKGDILMVGPTPLIAAMRCYVASKLGDEVEIPEELT
jgi:hypothetical protein